MNIILLNNELDKLLKRIDQDIWLLVDKKSQSLMGVYKNELDWVRRELALIYEKYGDQVKYTDLTKVGRLQELLKDITRKTQSLYKNSISTTDQVLKLTFEESFYRNAFALETTLPGVEFHFAKINEDVIKRSLENKFSDVKWPDSTRGNIDVMESRLRTEITQGFVRGKGYSKIAQAVTNEFDIGASKALRIVRTESHRISNQAQTDVFDRNKRAIENGGFEMELIWDATLDSRTRKRHWEMDGKKANENGKFNFHGKLVDGPGETGIAEDDINCRCRKRCQIKGYAPTKRRDNESKTIINHTSFEDWKKKLQ